MAGVLALDALVDMRCWTNKTMNCRPEHAATLVEASLAVLFLTMFLLLSVDVLRATYLIAAARSAVSETTRWASMPTSILGVPSNRLVLKSKLREVGLNVGLNIDVTSISVCSSTTGRCSDTTDLGGGELFVLRLNLPVRLFAFFGYSWNVPIEEPGQVAEL